MRRGGQILIVLGLVLGLITAGAVYFFIVISGPGDRTVTRTTKVVVAQQNISMHAPIPASALILYDWPDDLQKPSGAFEQIDQVAGKLTRTPIAIGQIVVRNMVFDKQAEEQRKGLGSEASLIVPRGRVAVAFPISQISGVSAALREGDTVDLIVSYDLIPAAGQATSGFTRRQVTQLTLQDVEILRVGPWNLPLTTDTTGREATNITFLVKHQDALVLKFLRETSLEVQLALRAAGDHDIVTTEPVVVEYVDGRFGFNGLLTGGRR